MFLANLSTPIIAHPVSIYMLLKNEHVMKICSYPAGEVKKKAYSMLQIPLLIYTSACQGILEYLEYSILYADILSRFSRANMFVLYFCFPYLLSITTLLFSTRVMWHSVARYYISFTSYVKET